MCAKARNTETYHDYEQALSQAAKDLPPVLVIAGTEKRLRSEAVDHLLVEFRNKHHGIEEVILYGPGVQGDSGVSIGDILGELGSGSLFASSRVLIVRSADKTLYPQGEGDAAVAMQKKFVDYLKSPATETWLILECDSLNRQRITGKALASSATVIPCPQLNRQGDVAVWLKSAARKYNKSLDHGVAEMLYTAHGGNLGNLWTEIEKLSLYIGDNPTITTTDVEKFLTGTVEFDVFGLTNAIEQRDLTLALSFARRICSQGTRDQSGKRSDVDSSAHQALAMLARTMEQIFQTRIVQDRGGDEKDVASEVGTSPWRGKKLLESAALFPVSELRLILSSLAALVKGTHDTGSDPHLALENAVLACCRRHR